MARPSTEDLNLADDLEALGLVRLADRIRQARSHVAARSVRAFALELLADDGMGFDEYTAGLAVELLRGDI
jgi:hypothetical protein